MRMQSPWLRAAAVAGLVLGAGAGTVATAQSEGNSFNAEEYFRGKTIEVVINAGAGGGLDTSTRFLLQGFDAYIPGNPRLVPTNIAEVPGIAAVHDAPVTEERITIGVTSQLSNLYRSTLDTAATHDPHALQIAGGYGANPQMTVIFNEAAQAYASIREASGAQEPQLVYAGMVGDASSLLAHPFYLSWLCDRLDLPCRMISVANDSMTQLSQDVERGQINMIDSGTTALIRVKLDDLVSGRARVLGEYADEGASEIVTPYPRPDIREFLSPEAEAELDALLPLVAAGGIGNAIFAGPDVPPEAVQALADAFVAKASQPEDLQQHTRARLGDYPGHSLNARVIGREEAQRLYQTGMERFFASQDLYKALQERLYDKYWK